MILIGEDIHIQPDLGDKILHALAVQSRDLPQSFQGILIRGKGMFDLFIQIPYERLQVVVVPPDSAQQVDVVVGDVTVTGFKKLLFGCFYLFVVYLFNIAHGHFFPLTQLVDQSGCRYSRGIA
ncbi:hypothetical protein SDC9_132548 [bioreactor metagenome]|uniref:Uncharacterized protein n=1 Tax=bioreactor metagenome TaxID=1076179 RepID=A0A645D8E3_9ZZZZ